MTHRHLTQPPSDIAKAKLQVLLESTNGLYQNKEMVLESDIVSTYHNALSIFFSTLDNSISSQTTKILPGTPADPLQYNLFTNAINRDLEAMFSEVGALDRLITSGFNSIISEREQILQISRRTANKLGDYLLYADPSLGGGYFFGDSFVSADRVDVGSPLVDTEECFLGQDEGVILLPLDGNPDRPKVSTYIINKPSNGNTGNNAEVDVSGKDDLAALSDNEPNTWFEYDRITAYESNQSLILDLTIVLEKISIINHININSINFGAPTPVSIIALETSKDGAEYQSVKDEVPIKDFVPVDEENTFSLSSSTSKYAGQGFYSFLPRKAQYIHVVFEQHSPYSVHTANGLRLRYAIGLRDINILGRKFKPEGSLVSTPFTSNNEIRKVSVWASENPVEKSTLADIEHAISYNDGAVWHKIQPKERSGFDIPEIVNFNNTSNNSITTSNPVDTLRHKIYMKRFTDAFNGNITIKQEKISKIDIVNVPTGGSPTVKTTEEFIPETVSIILPFWGSYSCPRANAGSTVAGQSSPMELDFVDFNVDVPAMGTLRYSLPYRGFANLRNHLRVFVNGEQWEYITKDEDHLDHPLSTSYGSSAIDELSKVYFLNKNGAEIQFGFTDSSGDQRGLIPSTGAKISICLDGDNPRLELRDNGYVLNLTASSDGFKENTSIVSINNLSAAEAADHQIELSRGKRKNRIPYPLLSLYEQYGRSIGGSRFGVNAPINKKISGIIYSAGTQAESTGNTSSGNTTSNGIKSISYLYSKNFTSDGVAPPDYHSSVLEGEGGILPPVFLDKDEFGSYTWTIEEFNLDGTPSSLPFFTDRVDYIDGDQEFKTWNVSSGSWSLNENAYSFDNYTGTVHLASDTAADKKTIFKCKRLDVNVIPEELWEYYRDPITKKLDTSKVFISPSEVSTIKRKITVSVGVNSQILTTQESLGHDWFNQRLVKGTVVPSINLFPADTKPVEVPFIDGSTELSPVADVLNENIEFTSLGSNLYSFILQDISSSKILSGSPGFAAIRSLSSVSSPTNIFITKVSSLPTLSSTDGDWYVNPTTGLVTVKWATGTPGTHTTSYKYIEVDPGVDKSGLYSIDYDNGTIHFSEKTTTEGEIDFEVSAFSAFYNIAEVIPEGDIKEKNEKDKNIILNASLGMKFLKMDTASAARPGFLKIAYEYYKKSEESIKDLEPYFSPICKDVAFRAITSDLLEEL